MAALPRRGRPAWDQPAPEGYPHRSPRWYLERAARARRAREAGVVEGDEPLADLLAAPDS